MRIPFRRLLMPNPDMITTGDRRRHRPVEEMRPDPGD
jgi:hypothetical protein